MTIEAEKANRNAYEQYVESLPSDVRERAEREHVRFLLQQEKYAREITRLVNALDLVKNDDIYAGSHEGAAVAHVATLNRRGILSVRAEPTGAIVFGNMKMQVIDSVPDIVNKTPPQNPQFFDLKNIDMHFLLERVIDGLQRQVMKCHANGTPIRFVDAIQDEQSYSDDELLTAVDVYRSTCTFVPDLMKGSHLKLGITRKPVDRGLRKLGLLKPNQEVPGGFFAREVQLDGDFVLNFSRSQNRHYELLFR